MLHRPFGPQSGKLKKVYNTGRQPRAELTEPLLAPLLCIALATRITLYRTHRLLPQHFFVTGSTTISLGPARARVA